MHSFLVGIAEAVFLKYKSRSITALRSKVRTHLILWLVASVGLGYMWFKPGATFDLQGFIDLFSPTDNTAPDQIYSIADRVYSKNALFYLTYIFVGIFSLRNLIKKYLNFRDTTSHNGHVILFFPYLILITDLVMYLIAELCFSSFVEGQESRQKEVREFLVQNIENYYEEEVFEVLLDEYEHDPQGFFNAYFNNSQSLFKAYQQKASSEGELNASFILNSLLIPRRKTMEPESLKLIFHSLTNCETIQDIVPPVEMVSDEMTKLFEKFSDKDIVTVFTRPLDPKHLGEILHKKKVLEVDNTLSKIRDQLQERKNLPPKLIALSNMPEGDSSYKVLRSKSEYKRAGQTFKNCVNTYFEKDSFIFLVFSGRRPLACVCVDKNLKIKEIAGPRNETVSSQDRKSIENVLKTI